MADVKKKYAKGLEYEEGYEWLHMQNFERSM